MPPGLISDETGPTHSRKHSRFAAAATEGDIKLIDIVGYRIIIIKRKKTCTTECNRFSCIQPTIKQVKFVTIVTVIPKISFCGLYC